MNRRNYKNILISLISIIMFYALYLVWWSNYLYETDKSHMAPKTYDVSVVNYNKEYSVPEDMTSAAYELPYLKIKSISFATDQEYLYIKYSLGGSLPNSLNGQSSYFNDPIKSVYFNLYLDENYFDLAGNKNPGGPEAALEMSFYQDNTEQNDNKIDVKGELLKGGPGKDYFVVRYPYYQLLLSQTDKFIVFTSYAIATSEQHPSGASRFDFANPLLAATPENSQEVKIDLALKSRSGTAIENTKY